MNLPDLTLESRMAGNSLTDVWIGHQDHLDRPVMVKVLKPDLALQPDEVERFWQEARRVSVLKHDNILEVYDVRQTHGRHYVLMEHASIRSLADWSANEPLAPAVAITVAIATAQGLDYAWREHRLIHCNLSPKCLYIDEARHTAKLDFFGLSRRVDPAAPDGSHASEHIVGTPHYMAPEQIDNDTTLDFRADMYGLGATLYHLLTGSAPFEALDPMAVLEAQLADQIPHPCDCVSDLHPAIGDLISRLMMKSAGARYPDWAAAIAAMERVLSPQRLRIMREPDTSRPTVTWSTIAQPLRHNEGAAPRSIGPPRRAGAPIRVKRRS